LVHGVLSNPTAWGDLANDLRGGPGFAAHYQLWAFRYSTSAPFLESASRLRRDLYRATATVDPAATDPAMKQIVLVGHSMGGLVCELQAASSENRLWNAIANRPIGQIVASQEARQALQEMFFFDPQPNVRRVISIGSPHQGSDWAVRPIGRLATALAERDADRAARHEQLIESNPGVFSDEVTARVPTSIDMLRPDSALLKAIASLPTSPCVKVHTIFGYDRENLFDGAGDGVVPVNSALTPKAASQLGIEASHTTIHRRLETVDEIVRILIEHWDAYAASPAHAISSEMPRSNR
jgi:pimeloyl-ACP methyl ester carboxylesterase